jgi:1-acyl-sn-glycerol-3-phosphate acyltransferase
MLGSTREAALANEASSGKAIADAMGAMRAGAILTVFLLVTPVFILTQGLSLAARLPWARAYPHHFMRFLCALLGINIEACGEMVRDGPVLIAANHVSYLDILVLSALGEVAFIAKTQVGSWPLFGQGARVMRTIFVDRDRRQRAMHDRDQIQDRLRAGDALVLFPEGTSTDGNNVAPFKSSLLSVAEIDLSDREAEIGRPYRVRVQPASVAYTRLNGMPMGRRNRPLFAWYGDMELFPHLWQALVAGPIDVTVHFHAPVTVEQLGDRKALTRHCEAVVRAGVIHALSGKSGLPAPIFGGAGAAAPERCEEAVTAHSR